MLVLATVLVGGCGGGPRQDAAEPSGSYKLEVAAPNGDPTATIEPPAAGVY